MNSKLLKKNLKLVLSKKEISQKIKELAKKIEKDYKDEPLIFIGTLKGAFIFLADLVRNIKNPNVEIDFVRVRSYGFSDTSSGKVEITKDIEVSLEGKNVILVEDIVDTGITLEFLYNYIKTLNPKSLKICVLIDKKERRKVRIPIDYVGFEIEKGFLVGYGLDFAEKYRHLPHIKEVIKNE
ncbi:hypoxanthine phosphoribosyltransferase [Thermodesulfobacterium geofontis OPF15]|jgi:hypoxanthine phosphoribosyltransferase|uniref:Hypoxanthine phosphoribosyltransferase n=1 Tax=Thermodesulfobacterium geofontis (strain OPF15) TaxID=795359 RepID=F8C3D8_THEGP|nr:hypoxanthine phosphoribosyltransferase [Thermodesulfobacterium geofontis]AEH23565.1 hypoxanthine phosphoribosyltransferase [Thermodesulfobacterium geofontis OPF15]